MMYSIDNLRSLGGVFFLLALAWGFSSARNRFPVRDLLVALVLQIAIGIALFAIPSMRESLSVLTTGLEALEKATNDGVQFAFGYLAGGPTPFANVAPDNNFLLAFRVLPLMIVISAFSALLWRWGILSRICQGMGFLLKRSFGLSGPVALSTAANIFLGMVEAPLVVRPYLERMSRSDLFLIMTTGMATVAGTVMALYVSLLSDKVPDVAVHVLVASLMATPGSIAIARLMEPPEKDAAKQKEQPPPKLYQSSMDAFSRGTQDGVNMFIAVIGMLVTSIAAVSLSNMILAAAIPSVDGSVVTVGRIFGWVLSPVMYMIGIPWADAQAAGQLMGTKTVLNELIAYIDLSKLPADAIEPRTRLMMIYCLCGFASFGALAIMVSGLCAITPDRRDDVMKLGMKSMLAGTLTTMLNGALIGIAPLAWLGL